MRWMRRTTVTLALATAMTMTTGQATAGTDLTVLIDAPETYYLARTPDNDPFRITLDLSAPEPHVTDVRLTIDATPLAGTAVLTEEPDSGCTRQDQIFTCPFGTLDGPAAVQPFRLARAAGAPAGAGGTLHYLVTSANAPATAGATRVVVGGPELTTRRHAPVTAVPPGSTVPLTPAFANTGELPADRGVGLLLYGQDGLEPAASHANCHYSQAYAGAAWCSFPEPVAPGTAYETDIPLTYAVGDRLMYGTVGYVAWPLGGPPPYGFDPADYQRPGSGPPLRLSPVDSSAGFTPSGGALDIATTQRADFRAIGATLHGRRGETVTATLGVRNAGPGSMDLTARDTLGVGTYEVIPPEGTTVTAVTYPDDPETPGPCTPARPPAARYQCVIDAELNVGGISALTFHFRVDSALPGAPGRITSIPRPDYPTRDPAPSNDTAPITLQPLWPPRRPPGRPPYAALSAAASSRVTGSACEPRSHGPV